MIGWHVSHHIERATFAIEMSHTCFSPREWPTGLGGESWVRNGSNRLSNRTSDSGKLSMSD